jgi:hypothetical protein
MDEAGPLRVGIWLRAADVQPVARPQPEHQPEQMETGDAPIEPHLPSLVKNPAQPQEKNGGDEAFSNRVENIRRAQDERRFEIENFRSQNLAHLKGRMKTLQAPLLADLGEMGAQPTYASPIAPLVYVELPQAGILEIVLKDYVETIYGPNVGKDDLKVAKPTQKALIVDNWFGFDGTGADVAHVEDSRVDWPHTYLNTGTTRVAGDGNVDSHATACTGMVASQHGTDQGIAQGANMFSANGTSYDDDDMAAAMDWAVITQDVDVMNNSYSLEDTASADLNDHDRHLDWLARFHACTIVKSAGNDGASTTHWISSPGKGYNVITVGAFDDQGTISWSDDSMAGYSSFNNPSTNCEKPELAASGSHITSTLMNNAMGDAGSGTSFSAPMVSGAAALLMDRNSTLEGWPEAVKAILMATALHNIEGSSRLSSQDGAGGVDMRAAFRVVDEGWWVARSVYESDLPLQYSIYAFEGQTIRAVIAWDSNPGSGYTTDPLEADIDLRLKNPAGTQVAWSSSAYNSFEIIEYTATETGYYTLEPHVWNWTGSDYTYMGVAWWPGVRALSSNSPQLLGTPPVSRDYFQFTRGSFWNAAAIRPPDGADYDLYLYADSAFGDPGDYDLLKTSSYGGSNVDFVLIDGNHAPSGDYFPEVREYTGSGGTYAIEWGSSTQDTADQDGTYGPYTMNTSQVIRVWDSYLTAGTRKYFKLKPVSGNADLGMALYDSDPGTSTSFYKYRANHVVSADAAGAGGTETMNYLETTSSDWMGLVVWNNGATTTTTFYLYTDTTPPAGTIWINGGNTYTNSVNVTLALSASDGQSGVDQMQFGNTGDPWSAWEPYGTSKSWTLPAGDGAKAVWVRYKNNTDMVSSQYSDSIILDTTAPSPNPMSWVTAPYELNTSQISMTATAATDANGSVSYYFDCTGSPTGGGGYNDSGYQSGTTYTDSGLGTNHQYGYRVRARDVANNLTSYSSISYDFTDIETPSGITFGTITSNSIQARSTNTPSGLTRGSSGLYVQNITAGTGSAWHQDNSYWTSSGLSPNTQYGFRARARNGDADVTPWCTNSYVYTRANPPSAGAFSNVTQTSIRANWGANGNPAGTQYLCENITAGTGSGWITTTNWNSTGLSPLTIYTFRVKARNGNGLETEWVSLGSQSTGASVPPCECDFEPDGDVDIQDLAILMTLLPPAFGATSADPAYDPDADFDGDGDVDGADMVIFFEDFGRSDCP